MYEDNGNKCGKCQNHDFEVLKKGHARDCPYKKCNCLKCRLLDARSDILQVISGKETKLKGTKKDPNCGFCQNHNIKILRKGHVRSCGFGQERHFRLDNCFDCEVHYIRNEVNRLQIKMRRAMKEDRTLTEEQRKTAREAITRDEVEKVCNLARLARKKRETILAQQASAQEQSGSAAAAATLVKPANQQQQHRRDLGPYQPVPPAASSAPNQLDHHHHHHHQHNHQHSQLARQVTDVWRPWSQHQRQAALAHQQQQQHQHQMVNLPPTNHEQATPILNCHQQQQQPAASVDLSSREAQYFRQQQQQVHNQYHHHHTSNNHSHQQQQYQQQYQHHQPSPLIVTNHQLDNQQEQIELEHERLSLSRGSSSNTNDIDVVQELSPPPPPPPPPTNSPPMAPNHPMSLSLVAQQQTMGEPPNTMVSTARSLQEQQLFNTLFRLIVAQFAQSAAAANVGGH